MCRLRLPRRTPRNVAHESTVTRPQSAPSTNAIPNFPEADLNFGPTSRQQACSRLAHGRYGGAVTFLSSLLCHASTCFCMGSKLRCIRSTPTEMQSINENDFECLASTGVKSPANAMFKHTNTIATGHRQTHALVVGVAQADGAASFHPHCEIENAKKALMRSGERAYSS